MKAFFKEHPDYVENDFYIVGESYARHCIPAFAARVHLGNKNKEGIHINLKGFATGNGLTNPKIQYKAYTDYALDMNLITKSDHNSLISSVSECEEAIKQCGVHSENLLLRLFPCAAKLFNKIVDLTNGKNYYDVRKKYAGQHCYDAVYAQQLPRLHSQWTGVEAGLLKGHSPLTFLRVHDAGHMVPMDQPKASLEMLTRWMQGKLTPS